MNLVLASDVADDPMRARNLARRTLHAIAIARDERHACAARSQRSRQSQSEPGRAAGDRDAQAAQAFGGRCVCNVHGFFWSTVGKWGRTWGCPTARSAKLG